MEKNNKGLKYKLNKVKDKIAKMKVQISEFKDVEYQAFLAFKKSFQNMNCDSCSKNKSGEMTVFYNKDRKFEYDVIQKKKCRYGFYTLCPDHKEKGK